MSLSLKDSLILYKNFKIFTISLSSIVFGRVVGSLIEILPDWKLPAFTLYAEIAKHDQQPMKIQRCVEALKQYFSQLAGGRAMQIVR